MKQKILLILLIVICLSVPLLLAGCAPSIVGTGDFLALPKMASEYKQLYEEINKQLTPGGEYAAPTSGYRRQAVQLEDLNGDGVPEAIVFLRTAVGKNLKVCLYAATNNKYSLVAAFEGEGTTFDSVYYHDIDGDGYNEIIVGRSLGTGIPKALTILSVGEDNFYHLLDSTYTGYTFADLKNMDDLDVEDLILIRHDITTSTATAEIYRYSGTDRAMVLADSAPLSSGSEAILRIKTGYLLGKHPALFVTSQFNKTDILVDICAYRKDRFLNITMDEETGISVEEVKQYNIGGMDVNGDSIFDLPMVVTLPTYESMKSTETFRKIIWRNYNLNGKAVEVMQTFQNNSDGWYFIIPDKWYDKITVDRRDYISGERTIVFSIMPEGQGEPVDILSIYTLTGDNKAVRSKLPGRFIIQTSQTQRSRKDAIFAGYLASLPDHMKEYEIVQELVVESFKLIQTDWLAGELTA